MASRDPHKTSPQLRAWLDPEAIAYALVGLVAVVFGARALARWVIAEWTNGGRAVPIVAVSGCALAVLALLFSLRSRKRFLYLGIALSIVGGICFVMASFGVQLPADWLN
jgi:hypothetical protein